MPSYQVLNAPQRYEWLCVKKGIMRKNLMGALLLLIGVYSPNSMAGGPETKIQFIDGPKFEQAPAAQSETFFRIETLLLTQDISVLGNRICHDNAYIYFKDAAQCRGADVDIDCNGDLEITPIRAHEKIRARFTEDGVSKVYEVNRIFQAPISYKVKVYVQPKGGFAQYVGEEEALVPLCCNQTSDANECKRRPQPEGTVVGDFRMAQTDEEAAIVRAMHQVGLDYVVSPAGGVDIISNLGYADLVKRDDFDKKVPVVSTPYCNERVNAPVILIGGEDSGGGGGSPSSDDDRKSARTHRMNYDELFEASEQLFIKNLNYEMDAVLKPEIDFSCRKVWEI